MRVLFWNINGVTKLEAGIKLRELVKEYKPEVLCIDEPKIAYSDNVLLRLNLSVFKTSPIHNSTAARVGNLWILWLDVFNDPKVINSTRQDITIKIDGFFIYFVHASYIQVTRRGLWQQLNLFETRPWLIIGDFNCVLRNDENKGCNEPRTSCINEFSDWMEDNNLFEDDSLGSRLTWFNGQSGIHRIVGKLDRVVINDDWLTKYMNWRCKALPREVSDHSILIESWSAPVIGSPDFIYPFKPKRLKEAIKLWNQSVFGNVNNRLKQAQLHMEVDLRNSDEDPSDVAKFNLVKDATVRDELFNYDHPSITAEERVCLDLVPSFEEIKQAVFDLDADSAPGPDGFSGCFYRHCWEIIHHDLVNAIISCWQSGAIPNGINSSLIILLSKERGANTLRKFRPIGLSNFFFKIFTKIIATRLGNVLDNLVSEEQVAFMKGRNIHENICLASEMVNEVHIKCKDGNFGLKLDISQAFDTVSRSFVLEVFRRYGSSENWCSWILHILQSARISILFNGNPEGYFKINRRLRQGNPLSPLIFILIEDVLSRNITKLFQTGKMSYMVSRKDRFLGVQVMPGAVRYGHSSPIIDKIKDQLSIYKGKILSFQDRVVLIKSVCSPYSEGGLSLVKMEVMNKALLMKLWWNIKNSNKKWARFLEAKFTTREEVIKDYYVKSSIFPGIKWVHKEVDANSKSLIGDGRATSLYFDIWYGNVCIADVIGVEDLDMTARVSDLIQDGAWFFPDIHMQQLTQAGVVFDNLPSLSGGPDRRVWMPDLK
ncbi:uncharacterized protein LOC113295543 [Papaver somniferum]|uniref:uncharacterized protein LOC113295543 n=1 Tax=Papaver somniferum TaxID=3469 RepID=UPI000E6F6F10|nr:uncharacterized protein LOC113295543 [Papaver somniferum]